MPTSDNITERTGGQVLIDALAANGVDRVFCVPGESYLAALDALYDTPSIDLHVTRNEGGAAYMADAYGKLTGRPGICFVTRGPGATNASGGLHIAYQDSTPMILFIGQIERGDTDREAFQEIDYRRMFGQVAKWVAQIEDAARIPEYVNRAFTTAMSGRPGPVVLALPEDMLTDLTDVVDLPPAPVVHSHPGVEDVERALELLSTAERPVVVIGGSGWSEDARADLEEFARNWNVPVATSFRCQDYIDNESEHYVGDLGIGISPALTALMKDADVILSIGSRLGDMTTRGYALLDIPNPRQQLIHVHASAEELGSVYYPTVAIQSAAAEFVAAIASTAPNGPTQWGEHRSAARQAFLDWTTPKPPEVASEVDAAEIIAWLSTELPQNAIIANGAGNYTGWIHRYYRYRTFRTQLAPTNGAMGYGVPASVAAKLMYPERTVVSIAGDGCFMMNGQELATAMQYDAAVIFIVINNGMFGTIRMHQERHYPHRVISTDLWNPDFVALAQSYGAHSELVTRTEDFADAFRKARAAGRPALIEVHLDQESIAHHSSLTALRTSR